MNNEDVAVAVVLGVSFRFFSIIHEVTASMGLEAPLTLAVLILAGVLYSSILWEKKRP